ncbi:MAG: MOP flippase family protein [Campylobacterales bacterium]|nr:MOP flippase family protein [Campylobacterales bacterium]
MSEHTSLKQKAISGVKWTTLSTIVTTLLQLLQLAILARFLDPSAFGLMALVMVVIGFSQAFLDMGISNAIIHKQHITHEQLSTLYWVNVLAGFGLFAIISAIAPLVSIFYGEPELTALIIIVGLTFLIQPFGQQFMVLWQKEMRFAEIARIDIVNKTISLLVSVVLAYMGYGVYSLVYGTLAGVVSQTIQFMILGLKEHKPSFVFNIGEIKEFLGFGAYQMGEKTINYFNSQIDVILIGKLLGTEALGIYSVAKQLIMRPAQIVNPIITKVTFPMMAKIQEDTEKLKNVYLKTINYLSSINFPFYAAMVVFAPQLVLLMFGEKWMAAIPIVQILSVYGAIRSTVNPIGSLLLAKGKANWGFWWNFGLFFYVPFGIWIASHWGLIGVSWGLVVIMVSLVIPNWYFLVSKLCDAKFAEYFKQILIPAFIAVIAGALSYFIVNVTESLLVKLIFGSLVGLLIVGMLNFMWNKKFLVELKGLARR